MSGQRGWPRFFRLSESTRGREREVDDELHFHIEGLVERHVAEGMSEEQARRVVMARFHEFATTRTALIRGREKEASTERRRLFFDGLRQDLRVSWRQYRKRPGFAVIAVVTLALGIGASTTLFSVVNGVLLDPLPYPHSERLVYVGSTRPGRGPGGTTAPEFGALKGETRTLERYAAYFRSNVGILLQDRPEQVTAVGASEDYVAVFGASPVLGRSFSEEDFRPGAPPVALLSHGAWQRYWGGDPEVIGTVLSTTGRAPVGLPAIGAPTVIGVMPPSMDDRGDLWVPFRLTDAGAWGHLWQWRWRNFVLGSVGRLRPGSSLADVQAEVSVLASRLASEHPEHYSGRSMNGRSLGAVYLLDRMVGGYRTRILLLFTGALVLLAISVTSLTGLFLARALDRRREFAVRIALGGGRRRIFRSLVTETVSFSLLGGGVGFAIAVACLEGLRVLAPAEYPRLDNLSPDVTVVLFALAVAVASGLVCALASLPSRSGGALDAFLRETDRTGSGRGTVGLRGVLVSAQVSLAVILLVGAGLLSASLARLRQVDPGMDLEGLLAMQVIIPASYEASEAQYAFFSEVVRRIEAVPGVVSASWTPDPPMYRRNISDHVRTDDMMDAEQEGLRVGIHPVGPEFLSTMGIPLLRGRGITWSDDATGTLVTVVDELTAERLWPGQDPLGKRLAMGEGPWCVVVGVAGRVHQLALSEDPVPEIYRPSSQHPFFPSPVGVVVRVGIPVADVAPALRAAVWEVDRTTVIRSISTVEGQISADLRSPRLFAVLSAWFSLSALVLTLAAIFGLMSYWVTVRTKEVGLRMALGARPGQVLWAVQRQSMRWVLLGLAGGLAVSAAASRVLNTLLFGVSPLDPSVFAGVGVGLGLAAILASMIPALQATRVDPANVLRSE
jgi:putative ABC transport system permease protein